jgi:uncharacterized protein YlaI
MNSKGATMPTEYALLKNKPYPISVCPKCKKSFEPFLRGVVQRPKRTWWGFGKLQPYCVLICSECKEIVGYEEP